MRELKFRAWLSWFCDVQDRRIGKMLYAENEIMKRASGFLVRDDMIQHCDGFTSADGELEWLQFTSLLDKNGKEIYVGDFMMDDCGYLLEVKFGKLPLDKSGDCVCTFPAFYAKDHGKLGRAPFNECTQIGDWMEIIGNIYENPELIGKGVSNGS